MELLHLTKLGRTTSWDLRYVRIVVRNIVQKSRPPSVTLQKTATALRRYLRQVSWVYWAWVERSKELARSRRLTCHSVLVAYIYLK